MGSKEHLVFVLKVFDVLILELYRGFGSQKVLVLVKCMIERSRPRLFQHFGDTVYCRLLYLSCAEVAKRGYFFFIDRLLPSKLRPRLSA